MRRVRHALQRAAAAFALLTPFFATESALADSCATRAEIANLRIAALQQQLMVAALTCHEARSYNRFVVSYRPALARSDRAMLAFFKRVSGPREGDARYDAYKTKLANAFMHREDGNIPAFCAEAHEAFKAAFDNRASLEDWVAAQPVIIAPPYEDCGRQAAVATASAHPDEGARE